MADISAIKLPSGVTYTLKDKGALQLTGGAVTGPVSFNNTISVDDATIGSLIVNGSANFINGVKASSYNGGQPMYFVKGTQTAATNLWTGNLPSEVTSYYDGLTIDYFLPYAGNSTAATLNLSGLGAKPVYVGNTATSGVTTHYPANTVIHLTYVIASNLNSGNGCWKVTAYQNSTYWYTTVYCTTAAATAAKAGACSFYKLAIGYFPLTIQYANTSASALTLNINSKGAKPIYINGVASSASNYTLPEGQYIAYYDGTNYHLRTDGKIPGNISGDAATVGGHTVGINVPSTAKFTDTTYSAGTGISLSGTTFSVKLGYTTSGNNRAVQADSNGNLYVVQKDDNTNTTYTFANGTNGFTVTPSGGTAQTVTVTPSIANNITGSGTNGYLAKFNGTNTITNGPALGSATTTYLRNDGTWATPTNTTYSAGTGISLSGTTFSLANNYGDTKNPYASKTAGYVLAAPSDADGVPSFRKIYQKDVKPIISKTFTDVIGTANTWAGATFFFGSIKPTSWYALWKIKFNIHIYVPGKDTYHQTSEVMMSGDQSTLRTYSSMNSVVNHLVYYGVLYRMKSAGLTNGYGHSLGCRFYSSNYPIDTNYKRTIVVDILETENCSFEFYDSCLPYASIPGTGTTNYDSYSEINWVSNGLQEAGDSDTTDDRVIYFGGKTNTSKGIWAGSLFMEDEGGTYQNICAASDGTITASNRTTATTKIANTSGFKIGSKVYYSNTNYGPNVNISGWGVVYNSISLFDTRYAFNTTLTAGSLTTYKPLYLVGTVSNGLFYLDSTWWTQTPTTTGKIYILVGGVYDSTTSNCRMSLYQHNPWYYYNGSKLIPYIGDAQTVNGHTVAANVPSGAKFTDTVTTATTTGSGNAVTAISASNGALTVTKGSTFLTSHQTVSNKAATLSYGATTTIATIGSTNITVTMPAAPTAVWG